MEVRHRQQIGLARGKPFLRGGALALGAMPVAAAVVGDDGMRAVFAARHMAAERRRAAALDRRHHLHLVEADVPGIGAAPRRPVVAEDIRDLQHWTGHDRGSLRRRLFLPALPGLLARLRQQVEGALDAGDHAGGDAGVARRRVQFVVTDPELKCYLPGIPRAMYLPYPFQITQSTNKIHIAYDFNDRSWFDRAG